MLFNPLFIQTTGQADASSSVLQSKLSNSSYLFSDIIKIINENTIGTTTVNSEAASSPSADLTGVKTNSSNPMDQLFASSGEKLLTNSENVSLNDLMKKILMTSNSEAVKSSDQNNSITNESTSSDKIISTLQKSDVKSLLQNLSAILSKLNISPNALGQIISGNTNTGSARQTNIISENLSANGQADSSIAELVINLSNDAVSKDSSTASVSTGNAADIYNVPASLLQTITALLANSANDSAPVSSQKTSTGNSKSDEPNQKVSAEAEQLAASMFNLFQNNNNLVLNINSDSGNIKIEISKTTAGTVQTNDAGNGAVVNTKNQSESPVNTGQQSVSVNVSTNGQETGSANSGNITSPVFVKTDDSIPSNGGGSTESFFTKVQAITSQVSDNSNYNANETATKSSNSANTVESFFVKAQTNLRQVSDSTNNYSSATEINNSINTAGSFFAKARASADQVSGNYTSSMKDEDPTNNANTAESFFVNARTSQNNTIGSNVNVSTGKNNDSNLLNNAVSNASDNNEMVVVTISSKVNDNTVITDVQNANAAKPQEVSPNLVKNNIPADNGNTALKNYILPVPGDKTEVATKGNNNTISAKADTSTVARTASVNAAASLIEPKGGVKNVTADSEFVSNLSKADNSSAISTEEGIQAVPDDVSKNIAVKANQISQAGITIDKPDSTSAGLTGDAAQVKADTQEVSQVLNTKHNNNSSDQQQNKSSDNKNGPDSKVIDQVTGNLFSQAADSVKEKFASQAAAAGVPEKTIKITEITKEISNIIQQNSVKSIVLQLKPESLGKIKVTVDVDNNMVNAKVEVDTEAVKQIVQNNSLELTNSLSSNGMHLSSLSVNVSSGEQKSYQPFNQKKKSGYSSGSKIMEDNVSLSTAKSLGYNTYEYLV